jgi:hypothetical protein
METRFRSPAQRQPAGKWTSSSRYKHQKRVRCIAAPVLLMFESVLARDESHHAAFGMNVFTAALEAAIRAVRIDRPLLVTLYR